MFSRKYIFTFLLLALMMIPSVSMSQVVRSTGKTMEASSQLIFWYDNLARATQIQLTNTSRTDEVEVHIQIYATDAFDLSGVGGADDGSSQTRCLEADFNDVLTRNDTHVYEFDDSTGIYLNEGEVPDDGNLAPAASPLLLGFNQSPTKGFVVITPVVGNGDNTAISFQNLIGTSYVSDGGSELYLISAMGRDAVNLNTGIVTPDGIALDGIENGFVSIQPSEINFNVNFDNSAWDADIVAIVFADEYNNTGDVDSYRAIPSTSSWRPFLIDFEEDIGSCDERPNLCFNNWGLNAEFSADNTDTDPGVNVCNNIILEEDPQGNFTGFFRGIITQDLASNQLAVVNFSDGSSVGADWANSQIR